MDKGSALFALRGQAGAAFDGSVTGVGIARMLNATFAGESALQLNGGFVEVARHKDLDSLQAFTIEVTVTPSQIGPDRRNIAEGQTPGIALFLEPGGKVVGSLNTAAGWVGVDSGARVLKANETALIRFRRDAAGKTEIEIAGQLAGSKVIPGPIAPAGAGGFKIGTWVDGARWPFGGKIEDFQIRSGAVDAAFFQALDVKATALSRKFVAAGGPQRVAVNLHPDASYARLQPIKDIMGAAGVSKLSDLGPLKIQTRTVMTRGKVIVASKATVAVNPDWAKIAKQITTATTSTDQKRAVLAQHLTNRNSVALIAKSLPAGALTRVQPEPPQLASINLRAAAVQPLTQVVKFDGAKFAVGNLQVLKDLELGDPSRWSSTGVATHQVMALQTIPIGSAVLIANQLDLTNTELVIEPDVTTFYLICDKIICGPNAKITWRRPGGSTPGRQANPDLDGRGWSGIHTNGDNRHGLDGEDGRPGEAGINGAAGRNAPHLEMWVKDLSALPNLDLNGEDGIAGGSGQPGGRGGNGANGHGGEWVWFFGKHCTASAGDGGHGGDGGNGGRSGRGGNGGHGGNITIGVLDGTLEATVTARSFKIKDQGGPRGRGGAGGAGGAGGRGGRSGNGEVCHNARDGHNGAQGQPGAQGGDADQPGVDGEVRLHEFSQAAWDELLTRPWLSSLQPTTVFPGDKLTLQGSRFTAQDRVLIGSKTLAPVVNADESISVTIPLDLGGGAHIVLVRRPDGTESNRLEVRVKPQLDALPAGVVQGADVELKGRAFLAGASVLVNGDATPATFQNANTLKFSMAGTGGAGGGGNAISIQVRNPDGLVSNARSSTLPRVLEIPFKYGVHNLPFHNFTDGIPDWGTFEDTFGTAEVWHEQLDPIFGHPILTAAFYGFYHYFLKGKANGGLATGFCTSLASTVADRFWQGLNDTHTLTKAGLHRMLTGVHGKLLSRESLIHFHDQGREGVARVEKTAREMEAIFLRGVDRQNAPLLFFIPSGEIWDSGYFDKLSDSHCIMPYRFVYPVGHPGPKLSVDGSTTVNSLDGVEMYCWDCNQEEQKDSRVRFRITGGSLCFDYIPTGSAAKFKSEDGITLGHMSNGAYRLADHDLPFSGPLGLTSFVIDFLLSPADLQVTDGAGQRTGNFNGKLMAEIADSRPCYLMKGAYMLPAATPLTRKIVGSGAGTYSFHSILPEGGSIAIENVATAPGHVDTLSVSADATQIRFTPHAEKQFSLTLTRQVGGEVRALGIRGIGGGPGSAVDITVSPELSLLRVGNRGVARSVEVRAFRLDKQTNTPVRKQFAGVALPADHDLAVAVGDWVALDMAVQTVSFQ